MKTMRDIINKRLLLGKMWLCLTFIFVAALISHIFYIDVILCEGTLLASLAGIIICASVYISSYRQLPISLKFLESKGLSNVIDEINVDRATLPRSAIYCGPRAFYSDISNVILPYSEIVWIYGYEHRTCFIQRKIYYAVHTRDGKKFKLDIHRAEVEWLVFHCIYFHSRDIKVGFSLDKKAEYEKTYMKKASRKKGWN